MPVRTLDTLKFLGRPLIGERHHAPMAPRINRGTKPSTRDIPRLLYQSVWISLKCQMIDGRRKTRSNSNAGARRYAPSDRIMSIRSTVNGFRRLALEEYVIRIYGVLRFVTFFLKCVHTTRSIGIPRSFLIEHMMFF